MYFHESEIFVKFVDSSTREFNCCDITDCSRVPPETAAYKKVIKTLKNHTCSS